MDYLGYYENLNAGIHADDYSMYQAADAPLADSSTSAPGATLGATSGAADAPPAPSPKPP